MPSRRFGAIDIPAISATGITLAFRKLDNADAFDTRCVAAIFDMDWRPLKPELVNKVLLPILGTSYGAAPDMASTTRLPR